MPVICQYTKLWILSGGKRSNVKIPFTMGATTYIFHIPPHQIRNKESTIVMCCSVMYSTFMCNNPK